MTDLKALAVRAADWINATPRDVYPMVRCFRRSSDHKKFRWHLSTHPENWFSFEGEQVTDDELIDRAKAMGWNPELAADPALPLTIADAKKIADLIIEKLEAGKGGVT